MAGLCLDIASLAVCPKAAGGLDPFWVENSPHLPPVFLQRRKDRQPAETPSNSRDLSPQTREDLDLLDTWIGSFDRIRVIPRDGRLRKRGARTEKVMLLVVKRGRGDEGKKRHCEDSGESYDESAWQMGQDREKGCFRRDETFDERKRQKKYQRRKRQCRVFEKLGGFALLCRVNLGASGA